METSKRMDAVATVVEVLQRYKAEEKGQWHDLADILETAGKIVLSGAHVRVDVR